MSTFTFNCPHCNSELESQDEWRGLQLECPNCSQTITVTKKEQPVALKSVGKIAEKPVLEKISFLNSFHGIVNKIKIGWIGWTVIGVIAIGIAFTLTQCNNPIISYRSAVNAKVAEDLHKKSEDSWQKLIDSGHFDHLSYNDMVKHIGKEEADKRQKIKNNK